MPSTSEPAGDTLYKYPLQYGLYFSVALHTTFARLADSDPGRRSIKSEILETFGNSFIILERQLFHRRMNIW